jgi:enolase
MLVKCFDSEFEVPDLLVDKFVKDFDGLPGNKNYDSILTLRECINTIIDTVSEYPEIIEDPMQMTDFLRALAMKKAMEKHGIFYDA